MKLILSFLIYARLAGCGFDDFSRQHPGCANPPTLVGGSLVTFIREADVRRYMKEFPIDPSHDTNPFSKLILENLDAPERKAWVKESWRQFLYWFACCEAIIDFAQCTGMVSNAVDTWHAVKGAELKFEEERNNGDWVRAWDIVLNELDRRPD